MYNVVEEFLRETKAQQVKVMLFWWFTLSFAWEPATKVIAKFFLTVIMAGMTIDISHINMTHIYTEFSKARNATTSITTTKTKAPIYSNLIPGIYDYQSSVNFDNYLKALG